MSKPGQSSSAWDDDWESQADTRVKEKSTRAPAQGIKLSQRERLAQHAESNRKLWESAEKPETFHFLESRNAVPLKSDFKPALQVLSRKPAPKIAARKDVAGGLSNLNIEDEEDDEDEQSRKAKVLSPEERRAKAQREREEKQKKYDEARQRLFGTPEKTSGASSPKQSAPSPQSRPDSNLSKAKGRGKGTRDSRPSSVESSNSRSKPPSKDLLRRAAPEGRRLYDPEGEPSRSSSPGYNARASSLSSTREDAKAEVPSRQPKPPNDGGIGFQNS